MCKFFPDGTVEEPDYLLGLVLQGLHTKNMFVQLSSGQGISDHEISPVNVYIVFSPDGIVAELGNI